MAQKSLIENITQDLKKKVLEGEWKAGGKIPTTDELSAIYSASRRSVQIAVSRLEAEGLVHKVISKGTFVSQEIKNPSLLYRNISIKNIVFLMDMQDAGKENPFFSSVYMNCQAYAADLGIHLSLALMTEDLKSLQPIVTAKETDGLIICVMNRKKFPKFFYALRYQNIPKMYIDMPIASYEHRVILDNYNAGFLAAKHLLSLHHTRIGMVNSNTEFFPFAERLRGFKDALAEAGQKIARKNYFEIPATYPDAFKLGQSLSSEQRASAYFTASGLIGMGLRDAFIQNKLHIPKDVAIITADNFKDVSKERPALTCLDFDTRSLGMRALDKLCALIRKSPDVTQTETVGVHLLKKEST